MTSASVSPRDRFLSVFNVVREELLLQLNERDIPQDSVAWYTRVLDYNVTGGKLNRGLTVIDTVQIFKGRALTEDEYFKAAVLGWAVEFLQAHFLVADDLMDQSLTRRGQPCWFRVDGVGNIAFNDSFILERAIYQMLRKWFKETEYYTDLVDLFHDITYESVVGQMVDLITSPEDKVDLNKFSAERTTLIAIYKTSYYSFYMPVALGMMMCKIPGSPATVPMYSSKSSYTTLSKSTNSDPYKTALSILLPLGEYFQAQDDYLDFSAPPEVLGKIGTDIIDNKCSWCINTAMALASPEQRKVLEECYGKKDEMSERRVKEIYDSVGIREAWESWEKEYYERLRGMIGDMEEVGREERDGGSGVLRREVFYKFLEKIYGRKK